MLCDNCRKWADTIQVKSHQPPWLHCHHELEQIIEPGEKDCPEPTGENARAAWKRLCDSMVNVEKPKEESDNPYKIMLELCLNNLQSEISKARKKL